MSNYLSKLDVIDADGNNVLVKLKDAETLALASEINANLGRVSNTVEQHTTQIGQLETDVDNLETVVGQHTNQISNINNRLNAHRVFFVSDYGAVGDGVTDDTQAIQNCIDAANGNAVIVFDPLPYKVTDTINVTKSFTVLSGYINKQRQLNPNIIATFNDKSVIKIGDGINLLEGCGITNMTISRTSMGILGTKTIEVNKCLYTTIENTGFSLSQYGLYGKEINGLIVTNCHGTTGGDLTSSDEVCGIYIDGRNNVGNSGLIVKSYIYYGYDTPNATSYGIKCEATAQGGDIRIYDVECSGNVNYGISILAGGGFANDIIIDGLSMDSVISSGIELTATANYSWQNCNITNVWLLLNSAGAHGISGDKFSNIAITNVEINGADIASTDMTALYLYHCNKFNVSNFNLGGIMSKLMQISNCILGSVVNLHSQIQDVHGWVYNSTGILFDNCYVDGSIFISDSTNCFKNNTIDSSSNTAQSVKLTEPFLNSGKGLTHQFTAVTNGIGSGSIAWSVNGGRSAGTGISNAGLLTIGADETATILIVSVGSSGNPSAHDFCVINVF